MVSLLKALRAGQIVSIRSEQGKEGVCWGQNLRCDAKIMASRNTGQMDWKFFAVLEMAGSVYNQVSA
jgi:hypothetical protein